MSSSNLKVGCFWLLVVCLNAVPLPAYAANTTSELGVSPAFEEVQLKEGQKEVGGSLLVTNNTARSTTLAVSVIDLGSLQASAGQPFLGGGELSNNMYGLSRWVHFTKQAVTVPARSSQVVTYTIQDDPSLLAGGHYGAILFKSPTTGSSAIGAAIQPIVSSLILFEKNGIGEQRTIALTHFSYVRYWFNMPNTVLVAFKNTGNVHVSPHGLIILNDPFGHEVSRGVVNADSSIILPGSSREYQTALGTSKYVFVPGIYTLALDYRTNGNEQPVHSEVHFLYISPLAIGVGVLVFAICVFVYKKRLLKRK